MSGKTLYARNLVLDTLLSGGATLSLYTTPPDTYGDGGVEVSGGGYVSPSLTFGAAYNGFSQNQNFAECGTATEDWGTIKAFSVNVDGNSLYWGYTTGTSVFNGDTVQVAAYAITITEN